MTFAARRMRYGPYFGPVRYLVTSVGHEYLVKYLIVSLAMLATDARGVLHRRRGVSYKRGKCQANAHWGLCSWQGDRPRRMARGGTR